MRRRFNPILFLIPRILGFLLAGCIYLFFIDISSEGFQFESFVLIATFGTVYLGLTLLSWVQPGISGITFIVLGVLYLFFALGRLQLFAMFIMSGIPIFAGLLFMIEGRSRKEPPDASPQKSQNREVKKRVNA